MNNSSGRSLADILSAWYLCAAIFLLGAVSMHCFPTMESGLKCMMVGLKDGPVQQAFSMIADGLEAGIPLSESLRSLWSN